MTTRKSSTIIHIISPFSQDWRWQPGEPFQWRPPMACRGLGSLVILNWTAWGQRNGQQCRKSHCQCHHWRWPEGSLLPTTSRAQHHHSRRGQEACGWGLVSRSRWLPWSNLPGPACSVLSLHGPCPSSWISDIQLAKRKYAQEVSLAGWTLSPIEP